MRNILVIGAGRSSTALIKYLLDAAKENGWFVTVADAKPELAMSKVNGHPNGRGTWLDVLKPNDRRELMMRNDVVVSLLPPFLHYRIARDCVKYKKHLVTSSFVSKDLYRINKDVLGASLEFMNEMSLEPGVEHLSAKQKIDEIKDAGGKIISFRSYMGGLLTKKSKSNPWNYKFSWHPRNVVIHGQGTSQYLVKGRYKFIPYNRLFTQYRLIDIDGLGSLEAYANRDSLLYRDIYGLDDAATVKRSTLRYPGFCDAWHALVTLGLTDDTYPILESEKMTYREFIESHLDTFRDSTASLKERTANFLRIGPSSEIIRRMEWLGLFDRKKIGLVQATPAQILQNLLEKKWTMTPKDRDVFVAQHVIKYKIKGKMKRLKSTLVLKGEDHINTAMSKFVSFPIGIFVKMLMKGEIKETGVHIPVQKDVYTKVLDELKGHGIEFVDVLEDI